MGIHRERVIEAHRVVVHDVVNDNVHERDEVPTCKQVLAEDLLAVLSGVVAEHGPRLPISTEVRCPVGDSGLTPISHPLGVELVRDVDTGALSITIVTVYRYTDNWRDAAHDAQDGAR